MLFLAIFEGNENGIFPWEDISSDEEIIPFERFNATMTRQNWDK